MLSKYRHNDIRMKGLDQLIIANGANFFFKKLNSFFNIKPFVVHANSMTTVKEKLKNLKENKLWYITENDENL